jgi:hypothetical protein
MRSDGRRARRLFEDRRTFPSLRPADRSTGAPRPSNPILFREESRARVRLVAACPAGASSRPNLTLLASCYLLAKRLSTSTYRLTIWSISFTFSAGMSAFEQ